MQACFIEVFECILTTLMPRVFALFLFDELKDGLACKGMRGALLANRDGFEPVTGIDIQTE